MNQPTNLIALFARGREIGYVVIGRAGIYRYGVKTIRGKRNDADFLRRVAKAVFALFKLAGCQPTIVIERLDDQGSRGKLAAVVNDVIRRSVSDVYSLMEISLWQVKRQLCGEAKATHDRLIETLMAKYPISLPQVTEKRSHSMRYWTPMFMALALADFARTELKIERSRQ